MATTSICSSRNYNYRNEMHGTQPDSRGPMKARGGVVLDDIAASHPSKPPRSDDGEPRYVRIIRAVFGPLFGPIAIAGAQRYGHIGKDRYMDEKQGSTQAHQEK